MINSGPIPFLPPQLNLFNLYYRNPVQLIESNSALSKIENKMLPLGSVFLIVGEEGTFGGSIVRIAKLAANILAHLL